MKILADKFFLMHLIASYVSSPWNNRENLYHKLRWVISYDRTCASFDNDYIEKNIIEPNNIKYYH